MNSSRAYAAAIVCAALASNGCERTDPAPESSAAPSPPATPHDIPVSTPPTLEAHAGSILHTCSGLGQWAQPPSAVSQPSDAWLIEHVSQWRLTGQLDLDPETQRAQIRPSDVECIGGRSLCDSSGRPTRGMNVGLDLFPTSAYSAIADGCGGPLIVWVQAADESYSLSDIRFVRQAAARCASAGGESGAVDGEIAGALDELSRESTEAGERLHSCWNAIRAFAAGASAEEAESLGRDIRSLLVGGSRLLPLLLSVEEADVSTRFRYELGSPTSSGYDSFVVGVRALIEVLGEQVLGVAVCDARAFEFSLHASLRCAAAWHLVLHGTESDPQ